MEKRFESSVCDFVDRLVPELWSCSMSEPTNETDLYFRCDDGTVAAHKLFLKTFCSTLEKSLVHRQEDDVTVILPEVSVCTVMKFLQLVYTGVTSAYGENEIRELQQFGSEILGFNIDFAVSVSVEPMQGDDLNTSLGDNVEDCTVEPPIGIYLDGDNWDAENIFLPGTAKRSRMNLSAQESMVQCPECSETFFTATKLHTHAVNCHYTKALRTRLMPEWKKTKGYCNDCKRQSSSLQSFTYHMGVRHRALFDVIPVELHEEYHYIQKSNKNFERLRDKTEIGSASFDELISPDVQTFLSSASSGLIQCPECYLFLESGEALYSHAIATHYYKAMTAKLGPEFLKTNGSCLVCKKVCPSVSAFVLHLGLQHKVVHKYMPSGLVPVYASFLKTSRRGSQTQSPAKRAARNSRGNLACPECEKTFDSISALYFHAAAIHYKHPLQEMYGEEFKLTKGVCTVCGSRLNSKQYYYIHMGSRHRVILQLMEPDIIAYYENLGKTKVS